VNDHLVDCFRHPVNLAQSSQRAALSKGTKKATSCTKKAR